MPRLVGMFHLEVGEGGGATGTPVDETVAAVDQLLPMEFDKNLSDRGGEPLIHRETFMGVVARGPKFFQLADDRSA